MSTKRQQLLNIAKCILYTSISGLLVGSLVSVFNYSAKMVAQYSAEVYSILSENLWYIPIAIMVLVALSLVMYLVQKFVPDTIGSGIPQVKGAIKGLITFKWLRVLLATFFNSMISFFVGLSLGSEGPSVQLGATASIGAGRFIGSNTQWDRYLIRGGASAGIATAFHAPLTGIIFGIEEAHDHFTPIILIATLCSVMSASIVSNQINIALGVEPLLFDIDIIPFEANKIYYPIILGIIIGLSSIAFSKVLLFSRKITDKIKIPRYLKLIIVFVIIGITNIFFIEGAGSGHNLIVNICNLNFTWQMLLLLLFVKCLFTILSFDSGATGGMFFPILTIGAIIGGIVAEVFIKTGMPTDGYNTIIICSMAAFLGAVSRTPLTAILAVIETTSFRSGFIAPVFTVCIAYIIIELLQTESLYDSLLKQIVNKQTSTATKKIVNINIVVEPHSFIDGKFIKDILWPKHTFVLSIVRNQEKMAVKGDTLILAGDTLNIQSTTYNESETTEIVTDLCTKQNSHSIFTKINNLLHKLFKNISK